MGRPLRITIPNLPFHILNRGNARQEVFRDKKDFEYYLKLIKRYKKEFQFKLFHFVLMSNHIHFQMEPTIDGSRKGVRYHYFKTYCIIRAIWEEGQE